MARSSLGVGPLGGRRPARWASARLLGVGPLVGRRPACWASARSLGVGPLVGRWPARWALARSLGVGPLVRVSVRLLGVGPLVGRWPARWASARSLGCRSARWAAARSLGRRPSICHSPRVGAPVCDIILPPPPPPPIGSTLSAPESVEIPLFTPSNGGLSTSVGASAAAAGATILRQPLAGEYTSSPSAGLPALLSRRIVELEFVEMSELLPDSWQEETQPLVVFDAQLNPRRLSRKAPVQDISLWIECFSRMAAVLVTRYPDKGPELWAYHAGVHRPGGAQLRRLSLGGLR